MKIKGLLADRQPLIRALEQETGAAAVYSGAPSFRYQVGIYTVLRDGSLEVGDHDGDHVLLDALAAQGLLERTATPQDGIVFSTEGFTGRTMVNLVNAIVAREKLINKAIGIPNAFHMGAELVRKLKEENPATMTEFMSILHRCGGDSAMKGLVLSGEQVAFTGFPETDACRQLAERIIHSAITSRWVKANVPAVTNEKYSFRVWLNSLGMTGDVYSAARAELLKNFTGDAAFRTPEQRAAFYAGRKRKAPEPEFILL